ncbi:E2 protein [Human papillomavirus 204]|uniref:Regulatory protein E2 n=1 Tax=Human papillomavirus 204 TaxID=1650736 RepID=A0A0F7GFW4_9PAPI|nr:E2 protein [Human papillomavirus 204]AKG54927.1 E2 protein [Human papillomavirus 204]
MENLSQRLESLQERLLSLYEQDSNDIQDQITHWTLIKQEQVLFHYARQNGVRRLGMQTIPTLAASEARAKQAIEMVLQLQSLANSPFGMEPWLLQDTSRERYTAAPGNTFKKQPQTLLLTFDNDKDNSVEHTVWTYIYYQNGDGIWHKEESGVDEKGIFFIKYGVEKIYYLSFADEATRYSRKGEYTVHFKSQRHSYNVSSVSSTSGSPGSPDSTETNPSSSHTRGAEEESPERPVRSRAYGQRPSTSPRVSSRRGGEQGKSGTGTDSDSGLAPPSPGDVGSRTTQPARRNQSRLRVLLQEARDPLVLCLKGGPNQLKCLRYRLKKQHHKLFTKISTTWHWVDNTSTNRVGNARMLIQFLTEEQRNHFLDVIIVPKDISVYRGYFKGF